jgi:hypothetical protein
MAPQSRVQLATHIRIAVYLATDIRSGDREHWSGDVFIDEVGWY